MAELTLRPYQAEAVSAVYAHLRSRDDNPCIVIPTGGGKTPIMATICRDAVGKWQGRVLILAHVKELLQQTARTLTRVAPELNVGVYSAGLDARDTHQSVIVAGIQSIYRRAHLFDPFDLVLVDECHLIPMAGEGMYRTLLEGLRKVNPHVRVVGLTATPYRLKGGLICQPDHFLNAICYEVGVRELIDQGYLCPLRGKAGGARPDFSRLHLRGGEFIPGEVEQTMDRSELVRMAVAEIIELSENREAVLIFTAGVEHGRHVAEHIEQIANAECGFICGTTAALERETLIQRFKDGELKFLANVNVLTTGFDAPNVDTVVLLRPTNSTGLYYQMVGRGFRLSENKDDCLVLDYGDNILRHGPVDALNPKEPGRPTGREAPLKECPNCHELVHTSVRECPDCGHEFPIEARAPHQSQAAAEEVLSSDTTEASLAVTGVDYFVHTKRGAPPGSPQTMRVEYAVGLNEYVSEWVCPEHVGFARRKAEKWWSRRSAAPMPDSAAEAVELAEAGALAETHRIVVRQKEGDRFPRIIRHDLGPVPAGPEALPASPYTDPSFPWPDDDIPF